jgi:hypothetical protein
MTTIAIIVGLIVMFFLGLLTGAALATLGRSREEERLKVKHRELINRNWPTHH